MIHKIPVPVIPVQATAVKEFDWEIQDEYDPMKPNDYEKIMKSRREKTAEDIKRDRDRKRRHESSGFAGRPNSDEEEDVKKAPASTNKAAIAPPPSLQAESSDPAGITTYGSSSVAAKIMAKYGFRDGQGLGKQEQGMSIALQVEKTSKRGGRIIHEKELMPPPTFLTPSSVAANAIPGSVTPLQQRGEQSEQSITEIIKTPSKVVLLRVSYF